MSLKRIRLGILTPSSNTALEPLTYSLISTIKSHRVSAHFSRFPVTTISLSPDGLAQFELAPILAAAELLAHAKVDVIGWSGTSAGWLGFERDIELCAAIEKHTGIKATTSVLALNTALEIWGVKRLGLVTPYTDDVQDRICENYKSINVLVGAEKHLCIQSNNEIAEIDESTLDEALENVVQAEGGVDAVTTFCTNLVAAQRVVFWEAKAGVPVFDTVSTVIWDMLRLCAVNVNEVKGWGLLFSRN